MWWDVWNSIVEDAMQMQFAEHTTGDGLVLEVCGLDCKDHFFIERTAAVSHDHGIRKFVLTAAVEQDSVLSIRPVKTEPSGRQEFASLLFQIFRVEKTHSKRIVHARPFEPLPGWPRHVRS